MTCTCCAHIRDGGKPRQSTAVAHWTALNGYVAYLCQHCLDSWFDNADDDEDLEPAGWGWLAA